MIPLFSVAQVREADNYAINDLRIPGILLMENASFSIYQHAINYFNLNPADIIGIVCGKGNNGGDGFALARHFINNGFKTRVIYTADEKDLKGDALENFNILQKLDSLNDNLILLRYNSLRDLKAINDCSVIFDALLGSGTKGEVRSPFKEIIQELNKLKCRKAAVDIPSGLDADTGYGEDVFEAHLTISLAEFKKGLFFSRGKIHSGVIKKGYIGFPDSFFDEMEISDYLIEPEDVKLPIRKNDLNKYSAGKVLIIAGSGKMPGAAILTSNAVFKVGAGAALLAFPASIKSTAQSKVGEVIIQPYMDKGSEVFAEGNIEELTERIKWMDVLAVGPGLGRDPRTVDAILKLLSVKNDKKIVIDADAIFALNENRYKQVNLKNCVITPHTGEFASLLGIKTLELNKNISELGRKFAKETGAYLVLKGAPTLIFNPTGEMFINSAGNSGMAKFGTGDVLTGVLAGLLAQTHDIEQAVLSGVYLHSLAADLLVNKFTEYGYTAADISDNLPKAIKFLRDSIV